MSDATELLLKQVETYCKSAGLAESTFGRQAVNDGKLCARLRAGKNVTLETAQKIRAYISRQAPQSGADNGPPTGTELQPAVGVNQ